jgi:hypothetical protein
LDEYNTHLSLTEEMYMNGILATAFATGLMSVAYGQTTESGVSEQFQDAHDERLYLTGVFFVTGAFIGLISSVIGITTQIVGAYREAKAAQHQREADQRLVDMAIMEAGLTPTITETHV